MARVSIATHREVLVVLGRVVKVLDDDGREPLALEEHALGCPAIARREASRRRGMGWANGAGQRPSARRARVVRFQRPRHARRGGLPPRVRLIPYRANVLLHVLLAFIEQLYHPLLDVIGHPLQALGPGLHRARRRPLAARGRSRFVPTKIRSAPSHSASRESSSKSRVPARAVVDESGGVPTRTLQIGSHPLAQAHPFVAAPAAKKREPCPPSFAPAAPASPVRCSPAPAATPPCPRSWCVSVRSPPARRPVREPHPPIFSP